MKRPKDAKPDSPHRAWFWLGIAAVTVIALIARWALYSEQRSFAMVQHAYDVIVTTDELSAKLGDVDDNAVAYLSTGRPNYRVLMDTSRETVRRDEDMLAALVQVDARQRVRLEKLRSLVELELTDIEQKVSQEDLASLMVRGGASRLSTVQRTIYEIRNIIGEMEADEHATLSRFSRLSETRQQTGMAALAGSTLLASCCLLLGQTLLNRNISRRLRAEEGLSVSEKRFEILCNHAPIGIYETDAEGFCVYTNPRWSEISGLTAVQSLGHGWMKVVHPSDRDTVFEGWQGVISRGASWEYRLITSQGQLRWIRALGVPIYSPRGDLTGYMGTLEDITERRLAARALEDREALNRAVLNSLPACIAVVKSDGTVQAANETWQKMARENPDSPGCYVAPGENYLEKCQQAAAEGSAAMVSAVKGMQAVLQGELVNFEMQYSWHQAAGTAWFHLLVTPLSNIGGGGAVIIHLDITRRKRAEERFRLVVEAAPSAFVVSDHEGNIRLVNSRAEKLFGYSRQELRGRRIQSLVPGHVWKPELTGSSSNEESAFAVHSDGARIPVEVELSTIETEEGLWILSSIVDVTERRNADLALRESRQELRRLAGRLIHAQEEERRRISRQLHDDLSQKLALLAFDASSLLMSSPPSENGLRDGLRGLKIRVVQLAQDVRQIAHQLHPAILEDLGLIAALTELCEEFSAREGIKARCEHHAMPDRIPKEAASCLYGVAQEALHNIKKHAHASKVVMCVEGDQKGICLSIRDDGVGFNEQSAAARHGLGIISMKERVHLVQGEFSIRSERGRGCEVNVFVPLPGELQ
jgi:PAS domain S-box-containing protein